MAKDIDKVAPALAVFGLDQAKKPHGSYFGEAEVDRAIKAAHDMGLFALKIVNEEVRLLAAKLPRGKLFPSGNAFVPFLGKPTFEKLVAAGEAAGSKLLRPEVLLVDRPAKPKNKAANGPAVASKSEPVPPGPHRIAQDWATIEVGCIVLAADAEEDGYFPAIVVAVSGDGKGPDRALTLQFRDFPTYAQLTRRVSDLALLHRSVCEQPLKP